MQTITLREVLAETNKPNAVFDLTYRKENGDFGEKKKCVRRGNDLNEQKKMNRDGKLKIFIPASGEKRDVFIDLLETFNDMQIKHPPYNQ